MMISIICPLYKGKKYVNTIINMIQRNIDCCKNNRMDVSCELIFVNDYPIEKIDAENNQSMNIIICENDINRGIHYSRVQGLNISKGEHILFLDQDDEISDEYIFSQLNRIEDADAIVCNGENHGKSIYSSLVYMKNVCEREHYFKGENIIVSPGQVLLRRDAILPFWTRNILVNNGADDYFLWLLLFISQKKIVYNYEKLYKHITTGCNTSNDLEKMKKSVYEVVRCLFENKMITQTEKKVIENRFENNLNKEELYNKYTRCSKILELLDIWLSQKEKERKCRKYCEEQGITQVVIYGCGILGKHLIKELKEEGINIECIIDKKKEIDVDQIPIRRLGDTIDDKSVIVVTPVVHIEEIRVELQTAYSNRIVHISQIVENMK